jgi:outer membrane protein OmpA-like peptidoglycan-associated protein
MEVRSRPTLSRCLRTLWLVALAASSTASAQVRGFAVDRFDGTAAGSSQFLVERPWDSDTQTFAVGLTADWAHDALVPRATGSTVTPILSQALTGRVDVAVAFLDRLRLTGTLPVALKQDGTTEVLSSAGPLSRPALGDPRFGVMLRLFGHSDSSPLSLHLGADVWVPIGPSYSHQSDTRLRLLPRAVLSGAAGLARWSVDLGFLLRPYASIGPPALGMVAASEARGGVSVGASLLQDRLFLGPEARFSMQVVGANAFAVNGISLEVLAGAHWLIADTLLIGVGGGTGFFGAAGTPDARAMVRVAWAPRHDAYTRPPEPTEDADDDGVPDVRDRCPFEPENRNGVRDDDGCPEFDAEKDGAVVQVLAELTGTKKLPTRTTVTRPSEPLISTPTAMVDSGASPTLADAGSPSTTGTTATTATATAEPVATLPDGGVAPVVADADGDGIPDEVDRCPATPEDLDGFEDEDGCPEPDNDGDGIPDVVDRCPNEAETFNGIDDADGCPDVAPDADGDGVPDGVDRCPFEPENLNGVRDEDGCPEYDGPGSEKLPAVLAPLSAVPHPEAPVPVGTSPEATAAKPPQPELDTDGDGIPDAVDRCPLTPEDRDGFEDEDGCPEPDNDGDGILDAVDRCPNDAETINAWKDEDGCPDGDPDADGDGVDYDHDRCPLEPGDASDGCPHAPLPALSLPGFPAFTPKAPATTPDAATATPGPLLADLDHDGVPDEEDACPLSPEDRDGFEDEDGCPEPDNDQDGIVDAKDKCPLVAETINGVKDDDGCPDVGPGVVTIRGNAVVIDGVVRFKTASATLERASLPLLQQVASKLRSAASLSIEIQGHTDDVGNAAANIKLSKRRADTIRAVLIQAGVAANRLVAKGYGPTRPRATNKTPAGREQNRRVEFLILGESK